MRWAARWLHTRVESPSRRFVEMLASVKGLTRIAANAPAYIEQSAAGYSLQFTHQSSLPETVIYLSGSFVRQLALPLGQPLRLPSP